MKQIFYWLSQRTTAAAENDEAKYGQTDETLGSASSQSNISFDIIRIHVARSINKFIWIMQSFRYARHSFFIFFRLSDAVRLICFFFSSKSCCLAYYS